MSEASTVYQTTAWRRCATCVLVVAVVAVSSACSDRNQPPASTFAKVDGQLLVRAKSIQWSAAPPGLPAGTKVALLYGNPTAAGRYVLRMQLPANFKFPMHSHSNAMDVTVVSGTLYVANSQSLDKKKAFAIKPGDFYHQPGQAAQFLFTKGEAVIEIHGDGPYDIKFADAREDPLKGAPPAAYSFSAGFKDNDMDSTNPEDIVDMTF